MDYLLMGHSRLFTPFGDRSEILNIFKELLKVIQGQNHRYSLSGCISKILGMQFTEINHYHISLSWSFLKSLISGEIIPC